MRHKPKTLEEIGLKNHLTQRGIDYQEFCRRHELGEADAVIARALSTDPQVKIDRRTISKWREIHEKEMKNEK